MAKKKKEYVKYEPKVYASVCENTGVNIVDMESYFKVTIGALTTHHFEKKNVNIYKEVFKLLDTIQNAPGEFVERQSNYFTLKGKEDGSQPNC